MSALTFMCGGCGERFASKNAKKRHKASCAPNLPDAVAVIDDERPDDADLYTRVRHITPEIKARAAAEWAAMDWRGRLPDGWTWGDHLAAMPAERRAMLEAEWGVRHG